MQERRAEITVGATGLDEELEMIREQFRRYSSIARSNPSRMTGTSRTS
jgi:hypothetical protein